MNVAALELLTRLKSARLELERLGLSDSAIAICTAGLARMEQVLARPPRAAILGEVNSGKTSVADLLLGTGLLPAGVVANTRVPVLMRYGETAALVAMTQDGPRVLTDGGLDALPSGLELKSYEIRLPSERLRDFEILDTPALGEPAEVVAGADIVIWCTVATRAWTESERAAWSRLPQRCRRNGLLVATHKDALDGAGDMMKIEQRLRAVTASMFRDLILVSAADAARSDDLAPAQSAPDANGAALIERVGAWADEIMARRARKAESIVRRLARLTFHELASVPLKSEAAAVLRDWERTCGRLLGGLDATPASLAAMTRELLMAFALALAKARTADGMLPAAPPAASADDGTPAWPARVPAARMFARLLAADLTALLRIELARAGGTRDAARIDVYLQARSILIRLAGLDQVYAELERLFRSDAEGTAMQMAGKTGLVAAE